MFYRPDKKSVCADVIPFYKNGEFKLFYLKDYRDLDNVGEGCDWNLLTTKDLVNFVDHQIAIKRGLINEQDLFVYTGSVFEWKDKYYIFYTGHNPHFADKGEPVQSIMLATSDDLVHWEKDKNFIFKPNKEYLEINDFRDPFVFYDDAKQEFVMILTSRYKKHNLTEHKGLLLKATSKDLFDWELDEKPFYAPNSFYAHECPDIFKIGEWYYLIFSEFSDHFATTYRMSKSIEGPWITPKSPYFDGHAFYAAKSCSDGKRRILFGWNPIKNNDNDFDFWQWGGNIVCQELYQLEDGTLAIKCPDEVKNCINKVRTFEIEPLMDGVVAKDDAFISDDENFSIARVCELKKLNRIEFDVIPSSDGGEFGLYLYEKNNCEEYYKIKFDLEYDRMIFDIWPRPNRPVHSHIDVERKCTINRNQKNHVLVLIEDSVLEVYLNDQVCLSARMFKSNGNLCFYSNGNKVEIKDICVYEK